MVFFTPKHSHFIFQNNIPTPANAPFNLLKSFFICVMLLVWGVGSVSGVTITAKATGNWSSTTTWTGGVVPVATNDVVIPSGFTVTLDTSTPVLNSLTISAMTGAGTNGLIVGTFTLNTGTISITGSNPTNRNSILSVSTGTINATGTITFSGTSGQAQLTFTGGGTLNLGGNLSAGGTFTASTGTVNCNGATGQIIGAYSYNILKSNNPADVTLLGASTITTLTIGDVTAGSLFSDGGNIITPGSGSTLNIINGEYDLGSATVGTTWPLWITKNFTAGTSTVGYVSGVAQAVSITPSYPNLTFSGGGTKTPAAGTLTVGGNWSVTGGAAALNNNNNNVNVTGDVNGSGNITQGTGLITIAGNWTNTGTFTASSAGVTLTGTSKSITGAAGLTFKTLTINGTYTNNNPGTLTVSTALSGSGTLTQAVNTTLNIGGTSNISNLDASTNTGNAVNYTGNGQTVHSNN